MTRAVVFLAMVVLATLSLALLGCDSADGPAVSNNEGGQPAVAGCAEAADCGAGQLCSGGVCVAETAPEGPGNVCETDGDCADGQICQQGACLADENPEVPATGCTSDDQCTQGLKCIEGDCVYVAEPDPPEEPCTTDADCGKEQGCIQGSCVDVDDPGPPEEGCDSNDDCEDEETCEDGVCVDDSGPPPIETCASDADCPEGKSCFAGICIEDEPTDPPVDECVFDSDCGPGQSCSEGACIDKGDEPDPPDPEETDCATDADCEDPTHKCTASEACPPPLPGGGPGMECLGICVPKEQGDSCFSDNECPEGLMCTCGPGGGWGPPPNALMPCNLQCMPEDPDDWGCVSDWDCKEGETCDAGECIPGGPITECIISGCSGEICAPMPGLSDCMWDPEYACLSQSECGNFGPGGSCGWKETDLYLQCLEDIGGGPDDGGCQADTDCGDPSLKCFIDPFCEDLPSEFNPGGSGPCGGICIPKEVGDSCWGPEGCPDPLVCECNGWGPGAPPNAFPACPMVCADKDGDPPPPTSTCIEDTDCPDGEICDLLGGFGPGAKEDEAPPAIPVPPAGVCINPCMVGGCSGQFCVSEPVNGTCEWMPEYACYQDANCGAYGANKTCGWQQTPALLQCLASAGGGMEF